MRSGQIRWYARDDGTFVAFGEVEVDGAPKRMVDSAPRTDLEEALAEVLRLLGVIA